MTAKATQGREKMRTMNEALVLGALRQHKLTEAAELSNALLQAEIHERKQAEGALRESEKRYRALFDLGPVAIYSCDASGVIQEFNRRAVELWGREPVPGDTTERFCGSSKMFRPDGRFMPHPQCPMAKVVAGKMLAMHNAEVIIERPDGSRITVVVDIRPLKDERGKVTGAINCFYDITERKQAEQSQRRIAVMTATNRKLELVIVQRRAVEKALKQSEQHQGRLLRESRVMQDQLQRLSRQILSAQEEERKRISRELHDVVAQTLSSVNVRLATLKREALLDSTDIKGSIAHTQELVERSVSIVHKFARDLRPTMLDDLGLIPALHAFMKGFKEETGLQANLSAFAGVEVLNNDQRIVFYRIAQEALTNVARHAQASQVEVSLQKLNGAVCMRIKDNGQGFPAENLWHGKKINRLGLLGMRERLETIGGKFAIESAPGKGTTITAQIPFGEGPGPKSGRGIQGIQVRETAPTNEKMLAMNEALLLGSIRQHELNEAADALNVLLQKEISERKLVEKALRQAKAQLADRAGQLELLVAERTSELTATNQQLEAFVYSIAHDLRAPLRVMQGFAAILVQKAGAGLDETGRDCAERINKSAQFMDAMLIDLLAFSRISQQDLELTAVNLKTVIESLLASLRAEIQEKNARVECAASWPEVLAHEPTVAQVLFNLVSNALKFVVPGTPPMVRLRPEEKTASVRVWVEDGGLGIASKHQSQIFRLFTRLNREKYEGTGLGLAIVQKGVERMGGSVGVESIPGQGSQFWFELRKAR